MKNILLLVMSLSSTLTWAAADTFIPMQATSAKQPTEWAAKSRNEALLTDSAYYSLPKENMSFTELGAYNQNQTIRDSEIPTEQNNLTNQVFYFKHSRGLTSDFALDFNLDYYSRNESSVSGATGVNSVLFGLRSQFTALDMKWIYGGGITYLPEGEYQSRDSKIAFSAKIGFEEAVDVARWGLETEATTKDTAYFNNLLNLVGFFEMPFVKQLNLGVAAGADLLRLSGDEQSNFAKAYGNYFVDSVSSAQLSLKQSNQKKAGQVLTETEVGLALTRVF